MNLSTLCQAISRQGFDASLVGEDLLIEAVATLEDAGPGQITFLSNPKYARHLETTRASAIVVAPGTTVPDGISAIECSNPYAGITVAIVMVHGHRSHPRWGISAQAHVAATATLGEGCNIAPGATIAEHAVLGARCTVYPGAYVGERAHLGDDVVLFPNVVVYDDSLLGNRVTIHAGSVIGEDGLGYANVAGAWLKIPQVGRAVLEDDVEIGANCTIDRATIGETRIRQGTKFSNLIAVGHGSRVGRHGMVVAQVGIAGSVTIGDRVTLAGQVGLAGHQTIGDDVSIAAQSGVSGNVDPGMKLLGSPAVDLTQAKRQIIAAQKLPQWSRDIEKRLRRLEEALSQATHADPDT